MDKSKQSPFGGWVIAFFIVMSVVCTGILGTCKLEPREPYNGKPIGFFWTADGYEIEFKRIHWHAMPTDQGVVVRPIFIESVERLEDGTCIAHGKRWRFGVVPRNAPTNEVYRHQRTAVGSVDPIVIEEEIGGDS